MILASNSTEPHFLFTQASLEPVATSAGIINEESHPPLPTACFLAMPGSRWNLGPPAEIEPRPSAAKTQSPNLCGPPGAPVVE